MNNQIKTFKGSTISDDFKESLNNLNDKISIIKKNITYYDVFNITETILDESSFSSKINGLDANSAAVINTPFVFEYNGESYGPGDIVLKNANEILIHIKSQSGGIFFPSQISTTDNNIYSINYKYQPTLPNKTVVTVGLNEEVENAARSIIFTGLTSTEANESNIYGYFGLNIVDSQSVVFQKIKNENGQWIRPIVRFYLLNSTGYEEVILNYQLVESDNNFTVEVGQEVSFKNELFIKVK